MFEKEAEEYTRIKHCRKCGFGRCEKQCILVKDNFETFKDGAEFGYNKANEWHFPSNGDYPEDYKDILICFLTERGMKDCVRGWCEYYSKDNIHIFKYVNILGPQYPKTVIAWKYLVMPEEINK